MKDILLMNLVEGFYRKQRIPILTEKELQQAYLYFLKIGQTQAVEELKKLTKINPSRKVSLTAQEFKLNEGKVGAIKGIQKVTGVKASFNTKIALNAYKKLNKVRTCHLIMPHFIKDINKFTGVKANKKIVNSWCDTLMKAGSIGMIRTLENMTGIESKYKDEVDFLLALRRGDFEDAKRIYEANKRKMKKFKEIERVFKRLG
jgi:hypothetical protein